MESVCRSQAYRGFESLPLYKAFQRELEGFFIGENDGILIPKVFENKKGTQFAKRMVLGFVLDALRADSETEWSCHSRTLSIKRMVLGFVQDTRCG